MTRLDSAREAAGRTKDTLVPYAATAKDTALHYAEEARNRLGPTLDTLGPKAAAAGAQARAGAGHAAQAASHAARERYHRHVAPQLENAFNSLPPQTQQATLKAVHRTQEAALAARSSAERAAEQARSTVVPRVTDAVDSARAGITPYAQEAQARGAAALAALQGNVSAAEINDLAARNVKRGRRHGWATGLALAGTAAIGAGVLAWQWWRKQSNPEWLTEPSMPTVGGPPGGAHASAVSTERPSASSVPASAPGSPAPPPSAADAPLNGSLPPGAERDDQDDPDRTTGGSTAADPTPKPTPPPPRPDDGRPKPHDPRKPH